MEIKGKVPGSPYNLALPKTLIDELLGRYSAATQIMIGGSYAKGMANKLSDVDVLVIEDGISAVVREVFCLSGYTIDLAIHSFHSVKAVLKKEQSLSICALADDIVFGVYIKNQTQRCKDLKEFAGSILVDGPGEFDFDGLKSHILGQIDDLKAARLDNERIAIIYGLAFKLMIYNIRSKGGWIGQGKYLARDLEVLDSGFIEQLNAAVKNALSDQDCDGLIEFVSNKIIEHTGNVCERWVKRIPVDQVGFR